MTQLLDGIDISRWQGHINWPIAARNIQFAFIKVGGSDQGFYPDGMAVRNVLEARANRVPIGFYVFLGGVGAVQDEVNHIKNLVNMIGGLRPGEPFVLDWEVPHHNPVEYVRQIAKGCIDAGLPAPLIYMSLATVRAHNWKPLVDLNCGLWVAAWGNNDAIPDAAPPSEEWPVWAVWQYSSTGSVPGISGRVDKNKFQGSIEQFHKYGSKNGASAPTTVKSSNFVPPTGLVEYTIKSGESLSVIAARFGRSWQELWNINRDRVSNPDKIFAGLKLRVWDNTPKAAPVPTPTHSVPVGKVHTVANGENLSVIARQYGVPSWTLLWEANRDIIGNNPDLIREGQRLRIP